MPLAWPIARSHLAVGARSDGLVAAARPSPTHSRRSAGRRQWPELSTDACRLRVDAAVIERHSGYRSFRMNELIVRRGRRTSFDSPIMVGAQAFFLSGCSW